ncbi:MAG: hypothetical protein KDA91_11585 [Planctomycetaceae bacterium]|nr:hypothetical protein [Planctomycetaceae bacterium]
MLRALVVTIALSSIWFGAGCSSESAPNGQSLTSGTSVSDIESDLRRVSNPGKYRLRNANSGNQYDIALLVADLNSDDARIRIPAAMGIPFDAPPEFEPAIEPLVSMLGKNSDFEKQAAAEGIAHLTFKSPLLAEAFQPLKQIIQGNGPDETRRWATIAIADIGPFLPDEQQIEVVELLKATINDRSYDIARFAMEGLGNLGPRAESAIPAILVQLDAGKHRTLIASHALEKIHHRPDLCVPKLIGALSKSPEWTEYILRALGAFGVDAAPTVPTIRRSLDSGDGNVLIAAAIALAAIGPAADSATGDLYRAFEARKDSPGVIQDEARIALLYAMDSVGSKGKARASEILGQIHSLRLFKNTLLPIQPDVVLRITENSSGIKTLLLSGAGLTDEQLAPVASLANLEELAMPHLATNDSFRHIAGLSKLRILKQDLWNSGDSGENVLDDRVLVHLQNCSQLQTLALRIRLSGDGAKHLAGCPELQSLTVLQMNDEALRNLPDLAHLETLNINDGAVSDAGIESLKRFATLRHLSLRSTDVTDTGIEQLALNHPGLVSLNLAHVNVTAASVSALSRLKNLKELIVYATPLAGSRDVFDMRMTPAVVQLIKALPNCNVIYAD